MAVGDDNDGVAVNGVIMMGHMNFLGELKHPCRHDAQNDSEVQKITHTFSIKKKN